MSVTVYRSACTDITLLDCLSSAFQDRELVGWCQTPAHLLSGRWDGDHWQEEVGDGRPMKQADLNQVFELCLFDETGELRWLRDPQKTALGRAAWISEDPQQSLTGFTSLPALDQLSTVDELRSPDGLVPNNCVSQRRARLPGVPVEERAAYRIREYIGAAPDPAGQHGNRIIVARRIMGITTLEKEINT